MLSAGPEVSLSGSPTVSPTTAALCTSVPLPFLSSGSSESFCSMNFLALSQAPPVLDMEMASCTPLTRPPVRRPNTAYTPKKVPATRGASITSAEGATISRSEASVEILMHLSRPAATTSLGAVPAMRRESSANWRFTSVTMAPAASPTDFIVMALNQYGSMAPSRRKEKVRGSSTLTPVSMPRRTTKAPYRARETSAAEPMANPLPMAAVVLPAASRASVHSRTSSSISDISAMPPALSHTGPYPSMVRPVASVESMPSAARATPYVSHRVKAVKMMPLRMNTGTMAER
mmetsp:Transcript_55567/g.126327  ORF Transcript_55567/g.126327 Transcript_55567/m.126327 type:complete len:290 (+) Transcript_55567:2-871(+)